jgi:membrane-bound serine protease (ClpP class)
MKKLLLVLLLFTSTLLASSTTVLEIDIKGAIGPASSEYLQNALRSAKKQNATLLLVKLDTPGGLSTSMREMIQDITNSLIPVVVYVAPKGARAASAGTYLIYAAHVAAMAPGTNIGAATPIPLIGANTQKTSTLGKKVLNDAEAYIQSLAQMNDRNATWALEAVKDAKSISAKEALKIGVIEIIADNTTELLRKLDGRVVKVMDKKVTLHTKNAHIIKYVADWKTKLLFILTDPNIAYIFLIVAIYGIFFELMHPGGILPGVLGSIAGVLALYALNILPFNYAGLLLILLGIIFMIVEVFVAGFGVLGIGGVIAFAFGSILLFNAKTLGSTVSLPLILAFSLTSLAFFIFVMRLFLRMRHAKVVSGMEEMIGSMGEVSSVSEHGYSILCHGEIWNALSDEKLVKGEQVEVVGLKGLTLHVKSIKE